MSESDQTRCKIIQDHPIANGLDTFHAFSRPLVTTNNIDLLSRKNLQDVTLILLSALLILPVPSLLQSKRSIRYTVRDDILRLISSVPCGDFNFDCTRPLLEAALADNPEDALIWDLVATAADQYLYLDMNNKL
ncbi:uncharacterized protein L203_106463 [Cryptococcus depauperatus CBS 7841]|uniref:Uncharacterized protein n=1 Tax=Cryptococcus depauperatus CBS 7841 TaxID=1295531 RepID=A0AAJ8JZ14_9TREE